MSLTIDLPDELADALSQEASRMGLPARLRRPRAFRCDPPQASIQSGSELVAYWKSEGVIGNDRTSPTARPKLDDCASKPAAEPDLVAFYCLHVERSRAGYARRRRFQFLMN